MKGLDKQVYIYSLGTECFYTDNEHEIHKQLLKSYILKKKLKESKERINKKIKLQEKQFKRVSKKDPTSTKVVLLNESIKTLSGNYSRVCKRSKVNSKRISYLKGLLNNEFTKFKGVRALRKETLTKSKIIGIFDSALSRTIGMEVNATSDSLFVVRAYYFNILNDIINNGFKYDGEDYVYFSSSAGQIRTKKTVFIKKSLWKTHEKSLTCGLTLEKINKLGGCNVNKYLAYKALTSSASTKWSNFDINKSIVVPDLETPVTSMFDHIDRETYEITRRELTVNIEHTDGCGMILPSESKKSFMVRLPFVKGLLVPFDFRKFALECGNTKIKDIYGKEWDIVEDNISIIFTKSQFKMAKYYSNWEEYRQNFNKYKCQANKLNEECLGGDVSLNYQMIQTLTDMKDEEIEKLCEQSNDDIKKIHNDKETILKVLGATKENKNKNYFQEGLYLYPELINDNHSKRIIKNKKMSMVNDARAGKLKINGKYLYLVPDLYAFCEMLFMNVSKPKGLLENNEVYTNVFDIGEVDILRSPHLYKEHAVRKIIKNDDLEKWFISQGIYTSIHDPISRILQFDNDGDKALVIKDDSFVEIAKRNMKSIVPLYYEMGVAEPTQVNSEMIYESLIAAFKANIGEVSNNITKIFNSGDEVDLQVVKWLTAENNYIIDYAKTLYMPERPADINKRIKSAIKGKVPYFFIEAKSKDEKNVESLNDSVMNKIRNYIIDDTIDFEDVAGKLDINNLMSTDVERINKKIVNKFKNLNKNKWRIIRKTDIKNRNEGLLYVYKFIRDEMLKLNIPEEKIVDNLIKDVYEVRNSPLKETLWHCYGDIIVKNIRVNLKGTKQCERCGIRTVVTNNKVKYCGDCDVIVDRLKAKDRMKKIREQRSK